MSEQSKIDAERAAFEAAYAEGPFGRTPCGARYISAPVEQAFQGWMLRTVKESLSVAPTVKAEQVPEFITEAMDIAGKRAVDGAREDGCGSLYSLCHVYAEAAFRAHDPDPSLPAAGSAVQAKALRAYDQPVRVAIKMLERTLSPTAMEIAAELRRCLGDAQGALSAQQSAPERVSVPRDLLADLISSDHDTRIHAERRLYALLASHGRGEA